jgi:hypothetical protein
MRFHCNEIQSLKLGKLTDLRTVLKYLCGEDIFLGCLISQDCGKCQGCVNWEILSRKLRVPTISFEEFNDILLLANQRPVSSGFFEFFFLPKNRRVNHAGIKQGVIRFLGFAILCFGNVRFAYRELRPLSKREIYAALSPFSETSRKTMRRYSERLPPKPLPAQMPACDTWLLGYIAKAHTDQDIASYYALESLHGLKKPSDIRKSLEESQIVLFDRARRVLAGYAQRSIAKAAMPTIRKKVSALQQSLVRARSKGWLNTTHYLSIDHMDVYVATSMRERWEYEDVSDTVRRIFANRRLKSLKSRYFDPTQSYLTYRIEKGLVEALMLKRAFCTVYLIQETDTLGKDSELASTLAQGKPVIAFVPRLKPKLHADSTLQRPVEYLRKRLLQLWAENKIEQEDLPVVCKFLSELLVFRPVFKFSKEAEAAFIKSKGLRTLQRRVAKILARAESTFLDARSQVLEKIHPLAVQVHLESGVANGVLVVRSFEDCAELLARLLTNNCEFEIVRDPKEGAILLRESISGCPFRVLTENATITNSFWSYYLSKGNLSSRHGKRE